MNPTGSPSSVIAVNGKSPFSLNIFERNASNDALSSGNGAWFALHMAFVAVAVSVSLLGSLLMTPSANLTLSGLALAAMFLFGRRLPDYADAVSAPLSWLVRAAYAIGPHAEFFDMRQRLIHGWGGVDAAVAVAVLAYAAAYSGACLFLAHVVLRRKRV